MKKALLKITSLGLLGGALLLAGCGGGGGGGGGNAGLTYSGNTSPAAVTGTNAEALATTTTDAVARSIEGGAVSDATPFGIDIATGTPISVRQQVGEIVKRIRADLQQSSDSPVGVTYSSDELNTLLSNELGQTVDWFCGGSLDAPSGLYANSGTMVFHDLCFDFNGDGTQQAIVNGTISFTYSESGDTYVETTSYTNVTVQMNGQTYTMNGTERCTGNNVTFEESCADLYTGADGNTYQVEDAFYYGNDSTGYYIDATFYHPTYGSVVISTDSPVFFNCGNGTPGSGILSLQGDGGSSATVTFNDCMSYTVTFDDGAGNTGTINGTW
jgi:hypothetical protein